MKPPSPSHAFLSPVVQVALVIVLLTFASYSNSFSGLFFFDDAGAIVENPTIRHWDTALSPLTNGTPVTGRPLVNLSFAMNYAIGGEKVWGYHAVNLLIHLSAALALFGLVRRTLLLSTIAPHWRAHTLGVAGAVAALWAVHPLQTESVTYLSQRAEALMGLFYFLTLYGLVRSTPRNTPAWLILSAAACLAGMASKEVMISAPFMTLLYDRTFVSGTFRAAVKARWAFYLALASTWLLLAWEMIHVGDRGGAVGTGLKISSWQYAITQVHAIVLYLGLSLWPHPLIFDYGTTLAGGWRDVGPEAFLLVALLALTGFFIWKRSALGFIGAWFFAILAPTSSVIPLAKQTIAEHRMYLPLAAVILLVVLALYAAWGRSSLLALGVLIASCVVLTWHRNEEYLNFVSLWRESLASYPDNPRAHINLGNAYVETGDPQRGATEFLTAIGLEPDLAEAHNNLGVVDAGQGRFAEAMTEYREAIRLSPGWEKPRENLEQIEAVQKNPPAK